MAAPARMARPSRPAVDGTVERARLIKLIHVGRRDLAMDTDAWRFYLDSTFKVQSSTQLSLPQLKKALRHLQSKGFKPRSTRSTGAAARPAHEWSFVDSAAIGKRARLRKILMLMSETAVPRGQQVAYVEGIAKQMAGSVDSRVHTPLPMCDEEQLQRIVVALSIHVKRLDARADDAAV